MVSGLNFFDEPDAVQDIEQEGPAGELHLQFTLGSGTQLALPAMGVSEVISITTEQLTPMPNVSPLLIGAMNLRGEVVWVADLGRFLGEPTPLNLDRSEVPVIAVTDNQGLLLGMAVDSIGGMQWLESSKLEPSVDCPDEMAMFVLGEWHVEAQTLRLLNQEAIIQSSRWAA